MKTELTPEEEKMIQVVHDEWVNEFTSLPKIDKKKAKELIKLLYETSGYKMPKVVYGKSPLDLQKMSNKALGNKKMEYQPYTLYGELSEFGFCAFSDYFRRIGAVQYNDTCNKYIDLTRASHIMFMISYDEVCYVCGYPSEMYRDNRNRLHNTNDAAIEWEDGYKMHFVDGIFFTPELFKKAFEEQSMSVKEIMDNDNVEIRAALMHHLMNDEMLGKIGKLIDEEHTKSFVDSKPMVYKLYDVDFNPPCRILRLENHTDHDLYYHFVPKEDQTATAVGALAWMEHKTTDEYKNLKFGS